MEINEELHEKYKTKTITINSEKPYWDTTKIEIFKYGEKIGEYNRNYPCFYSTFCPFIGVDKKEYALYSPHYTCTRLMTLPDCKDIGGEEPNSFGFCPTGYAVVHEDGGEEYPEYTLVGDFGFVCGCFWGDDSGGWKLQYLDLSKVPEGKLIREDKFGYFEFFGDSSDLVKYIKLDYYGKQEGFTLAIPELRHFQSYNLPVKDIEECTKCNKRYFCKDDSFIKLKMCYKCLAEKLKG